MSVGRGRRWVQRKSRGPCWYDLGKGDGSTIWRGDGEGICEGSERQVSVIRDDIVLLKESFRERGRLGVAGAVVAG